MKTIPDNFLWFLKEETKEERNSMQIVHCDRCGQEIQCETEEYEADACYDIDGKIICEDCILEYAAEMFAVKVIAMGGQPYVKKL